MMEVKVSSAQILKLVSKIIKFPATSISKFRTATELIGLLEEAGWVCPSKLEKAIIFADDKVALALLEQYQESRIADPDATK